MRVGQRWFLWVFFGCCMLWGRESVAQTPPSFTQGVEAMQQAYEGGEMGKVMKLAQGLLSPVMARYERGVLSRYYLYLGLGLLGSKQLGLGESALQRAAELNPSLNLPGRAPEMAQALMARIKRTLARKRAYRPKFLGARAVAPKRSDAGGSSVGPVIALSLGVVSLASLAVGVAAGVNAYVNVEDARRMRNMSIDKGFSQVEVVPVLQGVQDQAVVQGIVANVFYSLAAASAVGAVLVFFLVRPKAAEAKQAMHLEKKHLLRVGVGHSLVGRSTVVRRGVMGSSGRVARLLAVDACGGVR